MKNKRHLYCVTVSSLTTAPADNVNSLVWRHVSVETSLESVKNRISEIELKNIVKDCDNILNSGEHSLQSVININVTNIDSKFVHYTGSKPLKRYAVVSDGISVIAVYESIESKKYKEFIKSKDYSKYMITEHEYKED